MNAGRTTPGNKARKKTSPSDVIKTPGKGQRTLNSFVQSKFVSKTLETSARTPTQSKYFPRVISRGEPESRAAELPGDRETRKKRKLSSMDVDSTPKDEPRPKRSGITTAKTESDDKMKRNQRVGTPLQEAMRRIEIIDDRKLESEKKTSSDAKKEFEFGFDDADDKLFFDAFEESFKDEDCLKSNSTNDLDDMFEDDWNGDAGFEADLSEFKRCEVKQISRDNCQNIIVDIELCESQIPARVTLMDFWRETRLEIGDFVNIQANKLSNKWVVDNKGGFVIEKPDYLVSGTSVVGALFCTRRGVLSDRFKGIDSVTDCKQGANLMVIGSLVHELLQEVLRKKIYAKPEISNLLKDILSSKSTASMLYSASMTSEVCEKEMTPFVPRIYHFIEKYVKAKPPLQKDDNFKGRINVIKDIEENLWIPQLGVKGKVDVTVEVSVNLRPRIMPLELKTGRASFSLEHRGQVILYTMMMAVAGQDVESGLLLYLRENIMREIKVGYPERRDLMLLRNNLAHFLTSKPEDAKTGSDFEMKLPEPINHRACGNCPYSALCCAYLSPEDTARLSEKDVLTSMLKSLDVYLKPEHIEYVKRWVKMLRVDAIDEDKAQSARSLWTVAPREREKKGKCLAFLKIEKVVEDGDRYHHTFTRIGDNDTEITRDLTRTGFNTMEYVIVSTNTKVNVSAGLISEITTDSITVVLERNLKEKRPNDVFHIDAHSSQGVLILNLSNIGYLLDDTAVTEKIRRIVIEREPATFTKQLDQSVAAIAKPILESLNKTQQRAALKVLTANDYYLIKGMPGSGKTRTLVATIQLLVKMGKSVLLTAHTHSAVDNVLLKLIKTDVDFVRLGSSTKIHPDLESKSESALTKNCYSPESLDAAYNSKNVVCVTCLGANHPLLGRRVFDVCLVDESTQVLQSSILRPLYSASKFVLIGDPDQLPPVVRSDRARSLGMDQSLFDRLDSVNNTITLTSQYRMNRRIMSVANEVTYKGQLTVGTYEIGEATLQIPDESVLNTFEEWVRDALSTDIDHSVVALDTGDKRKILGEDGAPETNYHADRRCSNLCEAALILHLVTALIESGVVADNIGVIAPYREQVSLLRDVVSQNVEVNTVDQYQGRDKEIIFYSGTRSGSVRNDQEFNILNDHRRLTVAITRAKHKLIMIGDVKTLKEYLPFKKFFDKIRRRNVTALENGCSGFTWERLLSVVKQ